MGSVNETELWSEISKEIYEKVLARLREQFGRPTSQNRLAIEICDYSRTDIYTRIRITDGKPEVIQKVGDWNSPTKREITAALPCNALAVVHLCRVIENLLPKNNLQFFVMQFRNQIFKTADYEVKLTDHRTGYYSFEVEVEEDSGQDVFEVCKRLGLEPDRRNQDETYWKDFNNRVNVDGRKLTDEELEKIISPYLK
jgi:hypothetical protein